MASVSFQITCAGCKELLPVAIPAILEKDFELSVICTDRTCRKRNYILIHIATFER